MSSIARLLKQKSLPLPEENEELVDMNYIHWGFLNCCQTVSNGKKVKKERWDTYWVDLCGFTLRLYKDSSLPDDSVLRQPPVSQYGPLKENESKVAFFDLQDSEINVLPDGKVFRKKMPKSKYSKIFRQHLFQIKFTKMQSRYGFQAPSHSAMLRWVSKIQESIDASNNNEISFLAEERLKLAKFLMDKDHGTKESTTTIVEDDEVDDSLSIFETNIEETKINPRLFELKARLEEKQQFLWQLEQQIIDFLGNKGEFKRKEFVCKLKQNYYLVPSRVDTLIPAGTNVNIFGQLPNHRWRCLVELDELVKVMNNLVRTLETGDKEKNNGELKTLSKTAIVRNKTNNLPTYPLIGCIPTSILDVDLTENQVSDVDIVDEDDIHIDVGSDTEDTEFQRHASVRIPYSKHNRNSRSIPIKPLAFEYIETDEVGNQHELDNPDGNEGEDFLSLADEASDKLSIDIESESDNDISDDLSGFLRSSADGFIIRKKLRQKGISIIVGSSSSEDEDEEVNNENNNNSSNRPIGASNAVYRKFVASKYNISDDNESVWNSEEKSYIRTQRSRNLKPSYSCDQINYNAEFTTKSDLLHRFGKQSIHLSKDNELKKVLIEAFDTKKGPDVKPPRNERRTLKLSKTDDRGFGFWLQTYGLGKANGIIQKRTFVRHVEDEGPAYLAGLREGDVIDEVNGSNVEELDHMEIVELINEAKIQLILVVKFMDAVRRVNLAIRLKKRESKLKAKMQELENIKNEENTILFGTTMENIASNELLTYSTDIADNISLDVSTESSSMTSISPDEVTVRTSKFEERSSRVLDSIKELQCVDRDSNSGNHANLPHTTTGIDLLNAYSDLSDFLNISQRNRIGSSLRRVESMPVQKMRTVTREIIIDLDGDSAKQYSIEHYDQTPNNHLEGGSDDSFDDCSSSENSKILTGRKRTPSYKMAMKIKQQSQATEEIHL